MSEAKSNNTKYMPRYNFKKAKMEQQDPIQAIRQLIMKKPTFSLVGVASFLLVFKTWLFCLNYVPPDTGIRYGNLKMQAVLQKELGDETQLYIGSTSRPVPRPYEVLIKVGAFGINRIDIKQRLGEVKPPAGASELLGLEVAGTVEDVGKDVKNFKKGDRVFGLTSGGGYAEYTVVHQKTTMNLPSSLSLKDGASIPEAYITAYNALINIANIQEGNDVLIHAGASGVGSAAIQIAKAKKANNIIATSSSYEKTDYTTSIGATQGINYQKEDFLIKVNKATNNNGVDIVVDFVGADNFNRNIELLKEDGTMVLLGLLSGSEIENFDIKNILQKRLKIQGNMLRPRSIDYQDKILQQFSKDILPLISNGQLKPSIDKVFNWVDIADAHKYMEENLNKGKIVAIIE